MYEKLTFYKKMKAFIKEVSCSRVEKKLSHLKSILYYTHAMIVLSKFLVGFIILQTVLLLR